jgi:hypothetical protein
VAGISVVHRNGDIKFDTVGHPIPGTEVKIAEDGEILTRSPSVFLGYYKNPEATKKTLRDGWLYSGDKGFIDDDGHLVVFDRTKDVFTLKDGKPFLVTGSPGGSRIITAVLQVIMNVIDFHMNIADAVTAPRLHNQWQPDEAFAEPGFDPDMLDALKARGHKIVATAPHTAANSIQVTPDGYVGAADRRTRGATAAGY